MKKFLCFFVSFLLLMNVCAVSFAQSIDVKDIADEVADVIDFDKADEIDTVSIEDREEENDGEADLFAVDYAGLVEVGHNMPAFAASTTIGHEALYGNDGDTSTYWQKKDAASTERYIIALSKAVPVKAIKYITNAAGNGDNVDVFLSNDGEFNKENKVLIGNTGDTKALEFEFSVSNTTAFKYILLEKNWTNADDYAAARTEFTVAELEIYTDEASAENIEAKNAVNVAYGKTATASGKYGGLDTSKVTDNVYNDYWATDSSNSTWVMVDLGAEYSVEYITMTCGHIIAKDSPEYVKKWRSNVTFKGSNDGSLNSANAVVLHEKQGIIAENSGLMDRDVYDPNPGAASKRPPVDAEVSGTVVFEMDDSAKEQKFRYVGFTSTARVDVNNIEIYTSDTVFDNLSVNETDSNLKISSNIRGVNQTELQFMTMFSDSEGKYLGSAFDSVSGLKTSTAVSSNLNFAKPANANEADVVTFKNFKNKTLIRVFDNITGAVVPSEAAAEVTTAANVTAVTKAEDIVVSGVTEGNDVMLWIMPYGDSTTINAPTTQQMLETADALNSSNFNKSVKQAYLVSSTDGKYSKSFNMGGSSAGWYIVKAIFDKDVADENTVACFYFISEKEDKTIAKEFLDASADEIAGLLKTYVASFVGYGDTLASYGEDSGKYFTIAREAYLNGSFTGSANTIDTIADVKEVFDVAFTVAELMTNDEFTKAANFKADNVSVLTKADDYNVTEIETIFGILRSDVEKVIEDADMKEANAVDTLLFNFRKANALSCLYKGSYDEIKNAVTNADYLDVLGIEDDEVFDDVNTLLMAKKIGNTLEDIKIYASEGMQSTIETAIEKAGAKEEAETIIGDSTSKRGGGSKKTGGSITGSQSGADDEEKEASQPVYFNDLAGFDWAADAIINLYKKEIIAGNGDGSFEPDSAISREEITKMTVKAFYMDNIVDLSKLGSNGFEDCKVDEWYYPYVTIAKTNGVIKGVSDTVFGVGKDLTREDFAVIIKRVIDAKIKEAAAEEEPIDIPSVSYEEPSDIEMVSAYAGTSVSYLMDAGIITGYEDGTVRPLNPVSRAEAAVILNRVMSILGR